MKNVQNIDFMYALYDVKIHGKLELDHIFCNLITQHIRKL